MITDLEARKIASDWHGGQWTGLYALSSSGAIIVNGNFNTTPATFIDEYGDRVLRDEPDTIAALNAATELAAEITRKPMPSPADEKNLGDLWDYVTTIGPRGPVPGWANLTW